jgi:hypothetical protein
MSDNLSESDRAELLAALAPAILSGLMAALRHEEPDGWMSLPIVCPDSAVSPPGPR